MHHCILLWIFICWHWIPVLSKSIENIFCDCLDLSCWSVCTVCVVKCTLQLKSSQCCSIGKANQVVSSSNWSLQLVRKLTIPGLNCSNDQLCIITLTIELEKLFDYNQCTKAHVECFGVKMSLPSLFLNDVFMINNCFRYPMPLVFPIPSLSQSSTTGPPRRVKGSCWTLWTRTLTSVQELLSGILWQYQVFATKPAL